MENILQNDRTWFIFRLMDVHQSWFQLKEDIPLGNRVKAEISQFHQVFEG